MANAHRQAQEDRQIKFFELEPVGPGEHRHVLPAGDNWRNIFAPISGNGGPVCEFFRERRIKWWHSPTTGDARGQQGPTRNTLSSQVACVNVLMPLLGDPAALTAAMRTIDADIEEVILIKDGHAKEPSAVEFEWVCARGRRSLEDTPPTRGQRVTSADSFVVARLKSGALRGYLMEWKYVETGSEKNKNLGNDGEERRRRYGPWFAKVFKPQVRLEDYLFDPVYQLVRLSLLARRIVEDGHLPGLSGVRTVLMCPRANLVYRRTRPRGQIAKRLAAATVVDGLRNGLLDESAFIDSAPEDLVASVRKLTDPPPSRREWLAYMQARYGW